MKINIVSNRVLGLTIRQHDDEDEQRLAAFARQLDACEDNANESNDAPETHSVVERPDREDKHALFGARVIFAEDHFFVVFKTEILTDEGMCIDLEYESKFEINVPLDDGFKDGNFPYANAPAIAYPYLRAFISNLTLNSGYAPVMLPSLNFSAMKERIRAASR